MKIKNLSYAVIKFIINIDKYDYILLLAKNINMTNSYMNDISKILEKDNIIKKEISGRKKIITLTDKGNKIKDCLLLLQTLLENED